MMRVSPDGRRALLRDQRGWRLLDADSGAPLADIAPFAVSPGDRRRMLPVFLADGRILARRSSAQGVVLELRDRDGSQIKELQLEIQGRILLGAQPGPQQIWLIQAWGIASEARLLEVDLDTGSVVERARGVLPASNFGTELDPQSPGGFARWLVDADQRLRFLEPGGALVDPLAE